jgi:abequosyltransferase
MKNNIVLSICIATLNRAAFIGETLNSIISQATEEVEIVIVDGASTDNTGDIVKNYQQIFPRLRYYRLAVKGGIDQDYCRAVELSEGKYCWLFTDDDVLKSGAIKAVLDELEHNYGLILLNAEVRNISLSKVLKERCLDFTSNRVYRKDNSAQLFIDVADYISFIGCIVIKRSLWNAREKKAYYGTVFGHVGVIFQSTISDGTVFLADPLISIRYGNALWMDNSFEISLFKWPNLIWSFSDFSESAKYQVCPREPWRSVKALLFYRARGSYSLKEYNNFLKPRLNSPLSQFIARVIAQFPGFILNFGLYLYYSILSLYNSHSETRLVDLETSVYYYKRYIAAIMTKVIVLQR